VLALLDPHSSFRNVKGAVLRAPVDPVIAIDRIQDLVGEAVEFLGVMQNMARCGHRIVTDIGEFRAAVWASSPLRRIDTSVSDLFDRAVDAIVRAETTVDDAARPGIDTAGTNSSSASTYC
jgi:hypothetical protein